MQYISKSLPSLHSYFLPVLSFLAWSWFYIRNGKKISENKIIGFVITYNIVTINQCLHHPTNMIATALILEFLENGKQKSYYFVMMIVTVVIWPEFGPTLALFILIYTKSNHIHQRSENQKQRKRVILKSLLLIGVSLSSAYSLHYQRFFPTEFTPHSGVNWILYSHMFQNYLILYQTLIVLTPYIAILPLAFSNSTPHSKLAIHWFIITYTMNNTSPIHLWVLYFLESYIYTQVMEKGNRKQQIICNLLIILGILGSMSSYIFYERMIQLWSHTHLISIGYILLQILFFWGTHAVFLSEALTILDQEQEEEQKLKIKEKIKQYLITKIKQL